MRIGTLLSLALWFSLSAPLWAQTGGGIERAYDATLLMRTATFGAPADVPTTYRLHEYQEGRWVIHATPSPLTSETWTVVEAPMGGPRAGYVTFANSEKETKTLDVLTIDQCYGITGEVRIGW